MHARGTRRRTVASAKGTPVREMRGWSRLIYAYKSGLLDDTAAGVAREGRGSRDAPLSLLPRLSVPLMMVVARHPRAPGLLVLQRVVARPLPETLKETFLLGRVAAVRASWKRKAPGCEDLPPVSHRQHYSSGRVPQVSYS